jgi:hypothetical protein
MKSKHWFLPAILLLACLVTGCVSLKHVNDFSTASLKGLSGYSDLPYSYNQHCLDICKLDVEKGILSGAAPFKPDQIPTCNCTQAKTKDADAVKAYTALILYFSGLEKLSAGDQFVYKTADLTAALGKVKAISDPNKQGAVNKIADIVFNMATTAYREHALEKILTESEAPVDALLHDLISDNTILQGEDKGQYVRFLGMVASKYTGSKAIDGKEQLNDFLANDAATRQLSQNVEKIGDFNDLLEKIRQGHAKLAAERMNLKDKDLIKYLFTQASQLKTNIAKL